MASLLYRLKILPTEVGIDLGRLADAIGEKLPAEMTIRGWGEEPIAFGLSALTLEVQAPDDEGVDDMLDAAIRSVKLVSEVEILGVSKLSTSLRK